MTVLVSTSACPQAYASRDLICLKICLSTRRDILTLIAQPYTLVARLPEQVWSWGWNDRGTLGHGHRGCEFKPKRVSALRGVRIHQVAVNGWHCLALSEAGQVCLETRVSACSPEDLRRHTTRHRLLTFALTRPFCGETVGIPARLPHTNKDGTWRCPPRFRIGRPGMTAPPL